VSVPVLSEQIAEVEPRGLDRREPLHDPVAARDLPRPERQQRGHDRGQPGWDRRDGKRDAGDEQRLERLVPQQPEADDDREGEPGDRCDPFERPSSCFWSGVFSVSVFASMLAMWPISVAIPVSVTTNSPRPRVTEVFM
jgi:hypothetical protein